MADISITANNVVTGDASQIDRSGYAGETIAAGKVVYKDAATGKWLLADDNSVTVAARTPTGIALNGAALNQPLAVQKGGDITIGATLVAGTDYWLSDVPGGISPRSDLAAGEYPTMIGVAKTTAILSLNITASGISL